MVSFQALFPNLNQRKMIISDRDRDRDDDLESDQRMNITNSKKRKWDDDHGFEANHDDQVDHKPWQNNCRVTTTKSLIFDDIGLHLDTPLPSEWQRCLDIQSGEIHFYNTRTHKRTAKDPRGGERSPPVVVEASSDDQDCPMSLDLELNLPCHRSSNNTITSSPPPTSKPKKPAPPSDNDLLISLSSWTTKTKTTAGYKLEAAEEDEEEVEMVAAACVKCHMLVMLCKSSPTCPNCKFVHPPYQTPPDIFKPRLSLSC